VRSSHRCWLTLALVIAGCAAQQDAAAQSTAVNAQGGSAGGADLSGVWTNDPPRSTRSYQNWGFADDPPAMTPWAEAKFDQARPTFGPDGVGVTVAETNDPVYQCFPPGVPRIYFHPFPMEIIQTPGRVVMLFEYDHLIRQIYTDGRGHRDDLAPSWMGDSIGHWEGDTLVVETTNFNDKTWIDRRGVPHSEELRVLERIHRTDADHLKIDLTIEDPVAFPKPWTGERYLKRVDWDIEEFFCGERQASDSFKQYEERILDYSGPPASAAPNH
jgi:hypothetical protein